MGVENNARTVLCIDDEATGLIVRKAVLELQGYRVFTVTNGPEGLAILASETVDLVILDYAMPTMDGHAVAEKIRQLRPSVPILILSALLRPPSKTLKLVDQWIMKGEPTPVLLEAVAQLLSRNRSGLLT
jgi:CheY-like chemotaxis protein